MKDTAHPAPTAADSVYRQLKKQIIARCRQPGDRLREETIAKELDVSRTPVREAIRRLTAEGLATLIPNAGARLVRPTREEIVAIDRRSADIHAHMTLVKRFENLFESCERIIDF